MSLLTRTRKEIRAKTVNIRIIVLITKGTVEGATLKQKTTAGVNFIQGISFETEIAHLSLVIVYVKLAGGIWL